MAFNIICNISAITTVKQVFYHYQEGSKVDQRAYKPYTLGGPPALLPLLDPLDVIFLNNSLYWSPDSHMKLANFVGLEKTITEIATGCLRTMKSCHICIR